MFQYALGRNLSLVHKVPLKIDYSYLKDPNQSQRSFQLGGFQIKTAEANKKEIQSYVGPLQKILDKFRPNSIRKHIEESFEGFNENILKRGDGYFDGHWQNEKYFHPNESAIRQDFALKNPIGTTAEAIMRNIQSSKNPTSLHIRRGDYVTIPKIAKIHGTVSLAYYETACDKILEKFPDAHFFISSDDIAWVKENFSIAHPVTFVSAPEISDCEEVTLMSRCKHNIIANSTFSWWGAWLNQNSDKTVFTPRIWKKNTSEEQNPSLPDWFRL